MNWTNKHTLTTATAAVAASTTKNMDMHLFAN